MPRRAARARCGWRGFSSPAAANSLSPSGCAPDDTFIASNRWRGHRLKTNSPVAIALAALCFMVSEVNITMGGRECTALKKE